MKINIKFLNNKAIPTFVFFTALTGGLLYLNPTNLQYRITNLLFSHTLLGLCMFSVGFNKGTQDKLNNDTER